MLLHHAHHTTPGATDSPSGPPLDSSVHANVVIDMNAELAHWEKCYRSSGFHRPDFNFRDYLSSLKFAYDAYLRCHGQPLEILLPILHKRYVKTLPLNDQLEWDRMSRIVVAVWARLLRNGALNAKPLARSAGAGTALKTTCRLRGT